MRPESAAPDGSPQPLVDNRVFVLVLQHPQERAEPRATAAMTVAALRRARLVVGLSWPNLARALGWPTGRSPDPRRWGVLYLGSARPPAYPNGTPGSRRDHCAGPRRQAVARHRSGTARPRGHRAARWHLEPGKDAVVAQPMADEAPAARAEPDRPGTIRPAAPRTAAGGALDAGSRFTGAAPCRSGAASGRCAECRAGPADRCMRRTARRCFRSRCSRPRRYRSRRRRLAGAPEALAAAIASVSR